MNTIVYIVGRESRWNDMELKYSLRSAEKYCFNYDKVVIVGHKPLFIHNVTHLYATDNHKNKARNIMEKVMIAAGSGEVSDNFVLMNDDYFLRRPIDCVSYPYYHKCHLSRTMEINKTIYHFHVKTTFDLLASRGLLQENYDTHCPIIYNKERLTEVVNGVDWNIEVGHILRSLYCNTLGLNGGYKEDCKVNRPLKKFAWHEYTKDADCFSIGDAAINMEFVDFLNELYPNKSRFEV